MKLIDISAKKHLGLTCKVSDEDYPMLSQWKWNVYKRNLSYYVSRTIKNPGDKKMNISMHRVIMSAPKGVEVDHINGDSLDNRRENLRLCTRKENCRNLRKKAGTTSEYKGVHLDRKSGVYRAGIRDQNGKRVYLGSFRDQIMAAIKYNEAAIAYHGEFASLNVIPGAATNQGEPDV